MKTGTPLQIARAMQDIAFGVDHLTLPEYIDRVAANALKFEGVALTIIGDTDDALAASLIDEMVLAGLTSRL